MTAEDALFARMEIRSVPAAAVDWDAVYVQQLPGIYNFFRYRVGDGPVAEDLTSISRRSPGVSQWLPAGSGTSLNSAPSGPLSS